MDECRYPPPLTDEELEAFLDEADAEVRDHLNRCPACSMRLEAIRTFERTAKQKLHRWNCPDPQRLADYHFNLLASDQQAAMAVHLETCLRCREDLTELGDFLSDQINVDTRHEVPAQPGLIQRFNELIAHLVPQSPGLVLRGSRNEPLVAEADGITVFLSIEQTARGATALMGQITAEEQQEWAGALVEIWQQDNLQATLIVNEWGGFRYEGFQPRYPCNLRINAAVGKMVTLYDLQFSNAPGSGDT
jgi:hypothetical protein